MSDWNSYQRAVSQADISMCPKVLNELICPCLLIILLLESLNEEGSNMFSQDLAPLCFCKSEFEPKQLTNSMIFNRKFSLFHLAILGHRHLNSVSCVC